MRPVVVVNRTTFSLAPEEVAAKVLDVSEWTRWRGWGLVPAIREARFREKTDAIVGSRIEVASADGSTHVEEIVEWRPAEALRIRIGDFSPPLRSLASHFVETWLFERGERETRVVRSYELHPRGVLGAVALRVIAPMLRRAMDRHMREL